jgi:2-polyprenyl-3-methyl-5-hydroxy-6-metoxy-1,4-benzoquinol methylase
MRDYRSELFAAYHVHSAGVEADAVSRIEWFRTYASTNYLPHLDGIDPATADVLEVGCNKGYLLRALESHGFARLTGVDIASAEITQARLLMPSAEIHCADGIEFLRDHLGRFDIIIMKAVLEHIPKTDVLPFLRAMASALKPGGRVLVDVPNMDWLFAGHERYMDFTHEGGFTSESLRQTLGEVFTRVEVHAVDTWFPSGLGRIRRAFARKLVTTVLSWADAEGASNPIWARALVSVGFGRG